MKSVTASKGLMRAYMYRIDLAKSGLCTHITQELTGGEAEEESGTSELCPAPNPRTRCSLPKLYHPGMLGFEHVVTRGNKKCGLCPHSIHFFDQSLSLNVT